MDKPPEAEQLARTPEQPETAPARLPTFRGAGLQPGVDLDDTAALLDGMDSSDASR